MFKDPGISPRFVYCSQHLDIHASDWCLVPDEYKTVLNAKTMEDAYIECRARGFHLYDDVRKKGEWE